MNGLKPSRRSVLKGAAGLTIGLPMASGAWAQSRKPLTFWYEGATPAQQAALDKHLLH